MVQPFARLIALGQVLAVALQNGEKLAMVAAQKALQGYTSRGKGRGSRRTFRGNRSGKYTPHVGAKEIARHHRNLSNQGVIMLDHDLAMQLRGKHISDCYLSGVYVV